MSTDDEVRLLHESYQFLVWKYHLQSPDEDKEFRNDKKSTNQENIDLVIPFPALWFTASPSLYWQGKNSQQFWK